MLQELTKRRLAEFEGPDFALSLAELSCNGLDTFIQSHRLIAAQS